MTTPRPLLRLIRAARLATLVVGGCALLAACASAPDGGANPPLPPGDHDLEVIVDGRLRHAIAHVPANDKGPRALVVAFHGGGGSAAGFQRSAGLDRVADREGFVVLYPSGHGWRAGSRRLLTWNAGECCARARTDDSDDVAFTLAAIEQVAARTAIDRGRIYATGHSNGAMMTYRMAAEATGSFAAVAPVAGATPLPSFAPTASLPILHIHSLDDPRAFYRGGIRKPAESPDRHADVEAFVARWREHNRCPAMSKLGPRRERDGQSAQRETWGPCADGSEVALLRMTAAGHGWPGGRKQLPDRWVGRQPVVVDAAEEIWRFFVRFERRAESGLAPR